MIPGILKRWSVALMALLLLFTACHELAAQETIRFSAKQSTLLYGTKATAKRGDLELKGGNNLTWQGDAELVWDVDSPQDEVYELWLIANVRAEAEGETLRFKIHEQTYAFDLSPTKGPYGRGRNFQKVPLTGAVPLKKGAQQVSMATEGIATQESLLDFRALELVPVSARQDIQAEQSHAIAARASVDWLVKAGYGLMFHWTSESVQPDGSIKTYEEAVNDFDVERFSDMVEQTGASYVILTIGHAESYCPAPIQSWERCHPGQTTHRDFIAEIADGLSQRGVKLILYINGPLGFKLDVKKTPTDEEKQAFVTNFKAILGEMGDRYQHKIAGYWFDSWYQIFEQFPEVPFEVFNLAAKTGNKDRIICLNSWIYPAVTPWQDYWAGEVGGPIEIPQNGYMVNGPVPDLPYHALLIMEPYWVQKKAEMPEPRFNARQLSTYIQDCQANDGAVTINLGIYQNGTVGTKALQVMKEVKRIIRQ